MKEQLKAILQAVIAYVLTHSTLCIVAVVAFILGALIF